MAALDADRRPLIFQPGNRLELNVAESHRVWLETRLSFGPLLGVGLERRLGGMKPSLVTSQAGVFVVQ